RRGELPKPVELRDLRGDRHTHTTWSDGRDTLAAMVAGPAEKGSANYAVCDPPHRLRAGRPEAHPTELEALTARTHEGRRRSRKGIEVNIRTNGELDVSEDELATRDWVVASVHHGFDKSPTERVLAAMESPYVDCIGHVTNRKIGRRPAADVDVERVIEKAL